MENSKSEGKGKGKGKGKVKVTYQSLSSTEWKDKAKSEFMVFNTMSRQKELFKSKVPGKVSIYVCGITAYNLSHIGHSRAYVAFDVLYRYLKYLGYEVEYVRNFTDIDDKIINRANELKEDPLHLSKRFCDEFLVDMEALQCLVPTKQPRVTEHIEQIKDMIVKIIGNDCAYAVDGDVYFSVDKFPRYGQLSGCKIEDSRAGAGGRVAAHDTRKRNPADFALWKSAKPEEPSWDSPWGRGRPGWHIECSAMSAHYLGYSFDIHGGGIDLTFPHHENELAQTCAACSEAHISYWVHNGFVTIAAPPKNPDQTTKPLEGTASKNPVDVSEGSVTEDEVKMSKSLGNFITIRTVCYSYHPLALRYFLMGMHYRSPVKYSDDQLQIASNEVFYIYQTLQDFEELSSPFRAGISYEKAGKVQILSDAQKKFINKLQRGTYLQKNKLQHDFHSQMSDDLHTKDLLDVTLKETLTFMNDSVTKLKILFVDVQMEMQADNVKSLIEVERQLKEVLEVLGLLSPLPCLEVLQQLKEKALVRSGITEEYVLLQIQERNTARERMDYKRSDEIRQKLNDKGISLMDVGSSTIWRPKKD